MFKKVLLWRLLQCQVFREADVIGHRQRYFILREVRPACHLWNSTELLCSEKIMADWQEGRRRLSETLQGE